MHISNAINPRILIHLFFQCCSLFIHVMSNLYFFKLLYLISFSLYNLNLKAFISLYNISPFVINFHKRYASHWCKGLHWGRWLTLDSSFFMDTTCIVSARKCAKHTSKPEGSAWWSWRSVWLQRRGNRSCVFLPRCASQFDPAIDKERKFISNLKHAGLCPDNSKCASSGAARQEN